MTDPMGVPSAELLWPVAIANMAIFVGYAVVAGALAVGPYSRLFARGLTRGSGALFFVTCGLHHLMNTVGMLTTPHADFRAAMSNPMMALLDVVQAVAVWAFAVSAAVELRVLLERRRVR